MLNFFLWCIKSPGCPPSRRFNAHTHNLYHTATNQPKVALCRSGGVRAAAALSFIIDNVAAACNNQATAKSQSNPPVEIRQNPDTTQTPSSACCRPSNESASVSALCSTKSVFVVYWESSLPNKSTFSFLDHEYESGCLCVCVV